MKKEQKQIVNTSVNKVKTKPVKNNNGASIKIVPGTENTTNIKAFPVVGIGASAGGLEAFSLFLDHLPANLGMAYIFIQHLSPTHQSLLPSILERKTKMRVQQVTDNMEIEKDNLYIIPPNKTLILADGHLKLTERSVEFHVFHPVDLFFTTLAKVYSNHAIGIILSGTGTDGTEGLKAIKSEGGITFAQDETAKYEGMPRYAYDMGFVDFIMPPDTIASELARIVKHPFAALAVPEEFIDKHADELRKIYSLLNNKKDIDFSSYKQTTISRRIVRRMMLNKMSALDKYTQLLRDDGKELDALFHDLLINVTSFFREPFVKTALVTHVLPHILKDRKHNDPIRIWVPACATGEEAITIAIILLQFLGDRALSIPIQIFASDLNQKAIDRARIGVYSKASVENLSQDILNRYFVKVNGHYQVAKIIRDMCIFAPHNLLKDPPFSRMDIISCQNVLIYLESQPQQKIIETFHYALKPSGYLILGRSETIGAGVRFFEPVSKDLKLYSKKQVSVTPSFDFARRGYAVRLPEEEIKKANNRKESDIEIEADKLLLSQYVPASVLVNKDLEIVRFRGNIASFVEPATGKASLNLMKMVKEEIAFELRSLIQKAKKENLPVTKNDITVRDKQKQKLISLEVIPVKGNEKNIHFLIIFKEGSSISETNQNSKGIANTQQVIAAEKKIKNLQEAVKNITEEFEATREELQSSNEEVLSSNEELQSINEELETSKEELQSTNEELITINEELLKKNSELKEMTEYAEAIFETMHEALLILTDDLKVKIANKGFYNTFNVKPAETEGRHIRDLGNHQWQIPELEKMLRLVRNTYTPIINYQVTWNFPDIGTKTMLLNAQRLSLKDGREPLILLAVQDITARKRIEDQVKESEERLQLLIQNSYDVLTIFDKNANVIYESSSVEKLLGYKQEEKINTNLLRNPLTHPDDKIMIQQAFEKCINEPGQNIKTEFRLQHINGSYKTIEAIFLNLLNNQKVEGILANYRDITERKQLEQQKDDFIGIASHELKTPVTTIKAYTELLHEKLNERNDKPLLLFTSSMSKQIEKLASLIVDLLDFTRLENGSLKFRFEDFDMFELTKEIAESMRQTTSKHAIQFNAEGHCIVKADRTRTGEVLINLISNAIKYSPDAEDIIVSCECNENTATISVQDFGIGISKEKQSKIFNKFYREEDEFNNTFPGLGLGLYISSEIIKKQNGKIWMESKKGEGSTFYFSLPINVN